ncbi:MAG: CDP-glucose 4,6-dehydratase, partial [archaeon]
MDEFKLYKGKRVLITGHTGFKGSWLTQILIKCGAIVSGYALSPATNPSLFKVLGLQEKIGSHFGDIR